MVICNICKKEYATHQSRSNHMKRFHPIEIENVILMSTHRHPNVNTISTQSHPSVISLLSESELKTNLELGNTLYNCKYCNNKFKTRQSKSRHELKHCKKKKEISELEKMREQYEELKRQNEEVKRQLLEVQKLLKKSPKIHPKTLNKINNLMNNSCNNNNNTYNIQIIELGKENLNEVLTKDEKLKILNCGLSSLNRLTDLVHISSHDKFKQFKNVNISDIHDNYAYIYHPDSNKHIVAKKEDVIDKLVEVRMIDIGYFYEDYKDKMKKEDKECLKLFIDRMNEENDCMKDIKKNEIKLLLYFNNKTIQGIIDGITNDVVET